MVRTLDLFCGGGCSGWGAKAAGAKIVASVDAWKPASDTYKVNFPRALVVNKRMERDGVRDLLPASIGAIDLLISSPECTNHSIAKGAKPRDEESRSSGWYVVEAMKELKPRWFVLENVSALRNWTGYNELVGAMADLGYNMTSGVLDAADFGVPQSRRRLFIVGDRERLPQLPQKSGLPHMPARTILDPAGTWKSKPLYSLNRSPNTLARAEAGIEKLGKGVDFLVVYYGSDKAGGWQTLDRPLRTLTTLDRFGLVEWIDGVPMLRMLQIPELKRAMGLPQEFSFAGVSRRDQVKILGNGVCGPVMEAVVRTLTAKVASAAQIDRNLMRRAA